LVEGTPQPVGYANGALVAIDQWSQSSDDHGVGIHSLGIHGIEHFAKRVARGAIYAESKEGDDREPDAERGLGAVLSNVRKETSSSPRKTFRGWTVRI
jgi:hypothetical protein